MRKIIQITLLFFITLASAYAKDVGTVSVFAFLDGVPLEKNEIVIDAKKRYYTDKDGSVVVALSAGEHLVEIVAKDENGYSLGYVRKKITVKSNRDTQLIATFYRDGKKPYLSVDTPVGNTTIDQSSKVFGFADGSVVSDDEKREPIANARVFVKGTTIDARTDEHGVFHVKIPADRNVTLSVVHSEYSAQTLSNIRVKEGESVSVVVKMTPASMELEEFIVLAPRVKGSIASVMEEEKNAHSITNVLGSAQIAKKGDSDAAGALKRVTGVTIIGGDSVYVRGLGGRYSNVEMNSMPLPSPNPQSRSVPLDIFPAAAIEALEVQKSATADIPASFGGGYINIRTQEKANEEYAKISLEINAHESVGREVVNYQGSDSDFLGSDDGYRAIPAEIMDASKIVVGQRVPSFDPAKTNRYFQKITGARALNVTEEPLPFGGKIALEGAHHFDVSEKGKLAFFANYSYGQSSRYRNEQYYRYNYNQTTDSLYKEPNQWGSVDKTTQLYKQSGVFNVHYSFADLLNLKLVHLYSKISEKVTRVTDGIAGSNDDWRIVYDLNWEERTLQATQMEADIIYGLFDTKNRLEFGAEISTALLYQPSNYRYTYLVPTDWNDVPTGADPYLDRYAANAFLNLTTDDMLFAYYIKNRTTIDIFSEEDYFEIGLQASTKERESRYNKFMVEQDSFEPTEKIDTIYKKHPDKFDLAISFQPAYWYDADVKEQSYYGSLFFKPTKKIEFLMGARVTDFTQTAYQYTFLGNIFNPIERVPETLNFNKILPSCNLKYQFDKKNQIAFAYSQTYIVPDLREFTETEYFHPYDIATVVGNPELQHTDIYSYDMKYSHYFSSTENINIGLFYKDLQRPIEDVMRPSSSLPIYGFANADNAVLYGFEVDGRKGLGFVSDQLKSWYLSGNFSYTDSDVTLTEEQEKIYTTNHRDLQGLSKVVFNATVGYEVKNRSVTLSYNKMGERIRKVGMIDDKDEYPDHYEVPPQIVDFVWIEKFEDSFSLKVKLKNLLNEETIWYQGNLDNITKKFKTGRNYSISVSYKY